MNDRTQNFYIMAVEKDIFSSFLPHHHCVDPFYSNIYGLLIVTKLKFYIKIPTKYRVVLLCVSPVLLVYFLSGGGLKFQEITHVNLKFEILSNHLVMIPCFSFANNMYWYFGFSTFFIGFSTFPQIRRNFNSWL